MAKSMTLNLNFGSDHFLRLLKRTLVIALLLVVGSDLALAQSNGSRVRGALHLRGRLRLIGNSCTLVVTPAANQKRVRVRCNGTAPVRTFRNTRGIVYLRNRQSAVIDARNCFLRTVVAPSQRRVDLTCTARINPTPTPTTTATATPTSTPTSAPDANALISGGILLAFNADNASGATVATAVSGLNAGDALVSIDRRPQNGQLYGLGYNAGAGTVQLYAISSDTGAAKPVGTTGTFVDSDGTTPVLVGNGAGTRIGIDFNPAVDRLRIVTSESVAGPGQNFRINPNTGAFVDGDLGGAPVTGLNMDGAVNGASTTVQETAYTNNAPNATTLTQYTVDAGGDRLCIQSPPNSGTQGQCLALGQTFDSISGFDIPSGVDVGASNTPVGTGNGYLIGKPSGSSQEQFVSVNLNSGQINQSSLIGAGQSGFLGLALQRPGAARIVAIDGSGTQLIRFSAAAPASVTTVTISGVTAGDVLTGIDVRPATGQYYSLGINEAADTATLYLLDPQTGAATVVGSAGLIAFVDASLTAINLPAVSAGYGFDFNPVVDRIRVVTSTGLNFRLHPDTGAPVDGDSGNAGTQPDLNLNGTSTSADGASYTNSSAGQTVTTLYVLDAASDGLYIQTPPNNGTLTSFKAITLGGSSLDIGAVNGFDIRADVRVNENNSSANPGSAYSVLTVGGVTGLYTIDLSTGAATSLGAVGNGSVALAGLAVSTGSVR